jgi:prevent-host-death family protein
MRRAGRGSCDNDDQQDYQDYIWEGAVARDVASWSVADAKARLSEVIDRALSDGPQVITRKGRKTAVVVSAEEWERKTRRSGNLAEFFARSPLRGSELAIERAEDGPREIGL